jgi:hypothetical protein
MRAKSSSRTLRNMLIRGVDFDPEVIVVGIDRTGPRICARRATAPPGSVHRSRRARIWQPGLDWSHNGPVFTGAVCS